jgi:1-aminocyclopropane-1-carboxylate deaminase/D-cysteine desulfhydrase-like pyridoxal-dependent ACC family enzyme
MSLLARRWSGLATIPRVPLATLPTPVERFPELPEGREAAELWVKRDDLTSRRYGGNKVRKLEWLLGDAQARGCTVVVTTGAFGSNHVLATATHAGDLGLRVEAVMLPQPWTPHVETNLRAGVGRGAALAPARSYAGVAARMLSRAAGLRRRGERAYLVPPGGSSSVGVLGYVEAGLELAAQIDAGELPEPDEIVVAFGSGGTLVGLSLGLSAAGLTVPVVGVRVTDGYLVARPVLGALARRANRRLRQRDPRFPDVAGPSLRRFRVEHGFFGSGYGQPSREGAEATALARELGQLTLDPTYTSKAFAAALASARTTAEVGPPHRRRRVLYWHTLSSAPMAPLLEGAPRDAPDWARRRARKLIPPSL